MITLHTSYKLPEAIVAEAQRLANETGKTHYLAYLRAGKNEPLSIVTEMPAIGLAAAISPVATCPKCSKVVEVSPAEFERCTYCLQCFDCCAINCEYNGE